MFDGQSLNNIPSGNTMPQAVMNGLEHPWTTTAYSGISWTDLTPSAPSRLHLLPKSYLRSILVLTGGSSDIGVEGDSGATALAQMEAYADAARTAGFDRIIASTLTPSVSLFSAPEEAERLVLNTGIRSSSHWEAVADLANVPALMNSSNTTYYSDGLHWTTAGAAAAGAVVRQVLNEVLRMY